MDAADCRDLSLSSAGEVGTGWQTTRKLGRDGRYAALSSFGSSLRRLRRLGTSPTATSYKFLIREESD